MAYAVPLSMEEKDVLGSHSLEPKGEWDLIVDPTPDIIPAPSSAYISQCPVPVKPNVPYLGNVVLLQAAPPPPSTRHPLTTRTRPPDESAEGCSTHHAHRWCPPPPGGLH